MSPLSNYYRIGTHGELVDSHGARTGVVVACLYKPLEELFLVAVCLVLAVKRPVSGAYILNVEQDGEI